MGGPRWQQLQQAGESPGPRSSHCMAYLDGRIFMFGGELQPRVPVPAALYVYDLAGGSWSKLETAGACPGPRIAATMTAIGSKLYLFGGRTGVDMCEGATGDLLVLDTATATWSAAQPSHAPTNSSGSDAQAAPPARSYHAMTAAGGKLYVFGGCGAAGRLADLWQYDPAAGAWQQLPGCESVVARGGSVMVASGDGCKLFVMGGFNGDEMRDCHSYDIKQAAWSCPTCCDTSMSPAAAAMNSSSASTAAAAAAAGTEQHISSLTMPLARSVFGAAVHTACSSSAAGDSCIHTGHIIAFGGEVAPSDKGHAGAGNFCAATFCLSPPGHPCSAACKQAAPAAAVACSAAGVSAELSSAAGSASGSAHSGWHVLEASGEGPGPRGWFAAAAVAGGDLVVHGGLGADNGRLADMFRLCMH